MMQKIIAFVNDNYITIALHVLIWGALLIVPVIIDLPKEVYGEIGPLRSNFVTIANLTHLALFYFNAFYLYSNFLTKSRWWIYLICAFALIVVVNGMKRFILTMWFPLLADNEWAFRFAFFPTVFFLVVSIIYRLVLDKVNYEKIKSAKKAEQLATELKFLRSQVSPHFLFNVLNNLVSMARHKSDQLEPSLIKLSGLMRYMLYESDERRVNIGTEIEYLKSYIELQKLRFEEDIDISTNIQYDELAPYTIEPMLLIPFVENAFKHGVTLADKPFIRINLNATGNTLRFAVENKFGENFSKDKNSGIGLSNVKARLNLLYPRMYELSVEKKVNVFSVNLLLKLK